MMMPPPIITFECEYLIEPNTTNQPTTYPTQPEQVNLLERVKELERELADTIRRHGNLFADICYAAFGHSDALTDEQLVDSLAAMKKEYDELRRDLHSQVCTDDNPCAFCREFSESIANAEAYRNSIKAEVLRDMAKEKMDEQTGTAFWSE
jgi:hypothetical protein